MARQIRATWRNTALVSVFLFLVTFFFSVSASAEGITLNQCANGGIADPVSHEECHEGWISGNANKQKAAYAEGEFLPVRVTITGLDIGSAYTYEFSWDTLHSGEHALDYIGTYNHDVSLANACQGLSASICAGTVTTIAIPADPDLVLAGVTQIPGDITLFGGSLSPLADTDYTSPGGVARGIKVGFTPDQSTVVLTWGAHIASPIDWGNGNTASDINGSPYHTQNESLKDSGGVVVAGGGRDVSLSAAAVFVPANISVTKTANVDESFSFESFIEVAGMPMPLEPDGQINPWTLMTGESTMLNPMDDGQITISEISLPAGEWRINSIICTELGEGEVFSYIFGQDTPTDTAVFDIVEAGTYDCVFDNEFYGAPVLTLIKKVIGSADTCTDAVRDSSDYESRMIYSGESVKYCYWVSNGGSDNAIDVTIEDDMGTLDPSDDVGISLMGGTDIDLEGDAPDLSTGGEYAYGELVVQHLVANGNTITNVATAEATAEFVGGTYTDTDDASVTTDLIATCSLGATVTTGMCPGASNNIAVLNGDMVNWCATVTWDGNAALDLSNIYIELTQDMTVNVSPMDDMSPGDMTVFTVGTRTVGPDDFGSDVVLTGSEGGLNDISCQSTASENVVNPGLELLKLASPDDQCGNGNDSDYLEIFLTEPVWYCLTVSNTGDVPLVDIILDDDTIGIDNLNVGSLNVGENATFMFSGGQPSDDVYNTATATATEPLTGTTLPDEMSSATVIVLAADIEVDKDVDPGTIVICDDNPPDPDICTDPIDPMDENVYAATYTITVTNNGPSMAFDVSVEDELPEGFTAYEPLPAGCMLNGSNLECSIGDMAVDEEVVITIDGEIDISGFPFPWVNISNTACANPVPPTMDPDPSNNCDEDDTNVTTGPTHTIGYWGTHPHALNACMDETLAIEPPPKTPGLDLGFIIIRSETADDEVDATISTAVGPSLGGGGGGTKPKIEPGMIGKSSGGMAPRMPVPPGNGDNLMTAELIADFDGTADNIYHFAKGMINANPARWKNRNKRSPIDQARVKAGRQLTAAWCNEIIGGAGFGAFFLGWDNIRLIMAGQAYLDGFDVEICDPDMAAPYEACDDSLLPEVISSIEFIADVADLFNNSGGDLPFPFPSAPADPHAPEDDPTDPSD